jgi:predicted Rossmann fold nucleotide-binding protein DprA/Smf involved in DNA uptake
VERTGLTVPELNSHLTMLELQEIIVQLPGRMYAPARAGKGGAPPVNQSG